MKKVKLTENDIKAIVKESVKKIIIKEGLFKKIGNAIDRFENWTDDRLEDLDRGYDLKEGNPQSVLDVIEGDGWTYDEKNPYDAATNIIKIRKVTGGFGAHHGLSIKELINDINIFLDRKGHASFGRQSKPYEYEIYVDAPINLIKGSGLNESFEMESDMVKFYLNSPMNGRQVVAVPFEEFANAKYKNDYLWEKAAEQGNIKLMRNGYFEVDPNDPHKAEVDRIF